MSQRANLPLPLELCRAVDGVCDRFDKAWSRGERPILEEYLDGVPEAGRPLLRAELIRTELEWRFRREEQPSANDYTSRFPDLQADLEAWLSEAQTSSAEVHRVRETELAAAAETGAHVPSPEPIAPAAPAGQGLPRLLGEYELLEPLGAGGMGVVYLARHRRLDKRVALKLLPAAARGSDDLIARFLREMKAIGDLDHPNLVEALDAGESDGTVYLAMKLVVGVTLGDLVKQKGPLPVAEACALARQVAQGLDYLHTRGWVHRDLKPSNLIRTPEGVVKILDLGLAHWLSPEEGSEDLTSAGMILGTADYIAPEQVGGMELDARADLYGLGGVLFFLLTGRGPFAHCKGRAARLAAHVQETAPDVRALRPETPAPVANLVARLLARDPADRPASAAEVARLLASFQDESSLSQGTPTETWSGATSGRRSAPVRRWVARLGIAAAILVGLGLLASLAPSLWHRERPDTPVKTGQEPVADEPLRLLALDVRHFARVATADGKFDRPLGLLGKQSFAARRGDSVEVEARLSRPAYGYLIAFRPDGGEELCLPDDEAAAPPLSDRLRYPPREKQGVNYGLDEGQGLMVFAAVLSSRPLPPYRDWRAERGKADWRPEAAPPGVVWWDNGDGLEALTVDRPEAQRSKGREVTGKAPLARLATWLRQTPQVEAVGLLGFGVRE
jgi:serine/threonine protein kinase